MPAKTATGVESSPSYDSPCRQTKLELELEEVYNALKKAKYALFSNKGSVALALGEAEGKLLHTWKTTLKEEGYSG